jgi:hypothetical protein
MASLVVSGGRLGLLVAVQWLGRRIRRVETEMENAQYIWPETELDVPVAGSWVVDNSRIVVDFTVGLREGKIWGEENGYGLWLFNLVFSFIYFLFK